MVATFRMSLELTFVDLMLSENNPLLRVKVIEELLLIGSGVFCMLEAGDLGVFSILLPGIEQLSVSSLIEVEGIFAQLKVLVAALVLE